MISPTTNQAVQFALKGNWKKAIAINNKILEKNPDDTDTLNRLAYALSKIGQYDKAIKTYNKILKLDYYNPIAKKNLDKIKQLKAKKATAKTQSNHPSISTSIFIADAQKTKVIKLINLAPREELAHIVNGEEVQAVKRRFELQIKDKNDVYIGSLPDDVGHTIMKLIEEGKSFKMYIKDIQDNAVTIFIKY